MAISEKNLFADDSFEEVTNRVYNYDIVNELHKSMYAEIASFNKDNMTSVRVSSSLYGLFNKLYVSILDRYGKVPKYKYLSYLIKYGMAKYIKDYVDYDKINLVYNAIVNRTYVYNMIDLYTDNFLGKRFYSSGTSTSTHIYEDSYMRKVYRILDVMFSNKSAITSMFLYVSLKKYIDVGYISVDDNAYYNIGSEVKSITNNLNFLINARYDTIKRGDEGNGKH